MVTLSPILLMGCYAALSVYTRELLIINMWAGQLCCEGFNLFLKRIFKEERPLTSHGGGYGFPSSHSQFMGYFAGFLITHFITRHHFPSYGSRLVDTARTIVLIGGIMTWAAAVCYSRFYLTYHTPKQIFWGVSIGVVLGISHYVVTELFPFKHRPITPTSSPAVSSSPSALTYVFERASSARAAVLSLPPSQWFRVRDGWAVWGDGGREDEYVRWRKAWEAQMLRESKKVL